MIYITGDIHRQQGIFRLTEFSCSTEGCNLTKNDYLIIVGDFGGLWYGNFTDKYFLDVFDTFQWTTLFIDGNHENFNALNSYPIENWNGGKVHKITENIIHLMRGQVFTIEGQKFFTMGGATSIDKIYRTENISWWAAEMPSEEEYSEAINNLEKNNMSVDYVLSHCCGNSSLLSINPRFKTDTLTSFFEHLEYDFHLKYKHWYFGHYHEDVRIDNKHTCLYEEVIKCGGPLKHLPFANEFKNF